MRTVRLAIGTATYGRLAEQAPIPAEQTPLSATHQLVHPHPLPGCPWCPQDGLTCPCGLPAVDCGHAWDHHCADRGTETTWRTRGAS